MTTRAIVVISIWREVRIASSSCRQAIGPAPASQGSGGSRSRRAPGPTGIAMPPPCLVRRIRSKTFWLIVAAASM